MYYVFCELETETLRMLKTLTAEEKQTPAVAHALRIRNALVQGNYARFFKLYQESPGKAGALTDVFIDKIRTQCLQKLAVGFIATNIDLDYLARLLAFKDTAEIEKFLTDRSKCPIRPWPPPLLTCNSLPSRLRFCGGKRTRAPPRLQGKHAAPAAGALARETLR